jgi:5,5'-dehydrodivanillate O-demethylase
MPCNWLQFVENRLDPVHAEWLHIYQSNWVARKAGIKPTRTHLRHIKIDFVLHEYGIFKRRLLEGEDPETAGDWVTGHTMLFPNVVAGGMLQYDVPIDDTHTVNWHYRIRERRSDEEPQASVPAYNVPLYHEDGRMVVETVGGQDRSAWIQQGPVTPRDLENLSRSDRGIVMYRKWLAENIERVANGEDPDGLIRDRALNEPMMMVPGFHGSRANSVGIVESATP